jgi:hypothetical protein
VIRKCIYFNKRLNDRFPLRFTDLTPVLYILLFYISPAEVSAKAGSIVTPRNVVIENGSLGRSSHAGIHGNSVEGLVVKNVKISNFEVAGIQCNGCRDVSITNSEVGPSAHNVPVLATFSNARFLEFFVKRLIPSGFQREPESDVLLGLFDQTITFADRPEETVSLQAVFDRLSRAVELFQ